MIFYYELIVNIYDIESFIILRFLNIPYLNILLKEQWYEFNDSSVIINGKDILYYNSYFYFILKMIFQNDNIKIFIDNNFEFDYSKSNLINNINNLN